MITDLLDGLADLPVPLLVAVAGALVLAETTLGVGFLVPGETGLLLAATGVTDAATFLAMVAVVSACAAAGDSLGWLIGRRYGDRLRDSRAIARLGREHWDRAGDLLRGRGAWAVLGGRFLPVVRTLVPAAAGASGLPYRTFLPASTAGAVGWTVLHVSIGAGAGASARRIEGAIGTASWAVLAAALLAAATAVALHRRRAAATRAAGTDATPGVPTPSDRAR